MQRELVERAARGDQQAFEALVRLSANRLFAIAYRIGAESGQPADGGSVGGDGIDVANDPGDPTVIVVTWTGTPCDTIHRLDIEPDGRTMTLSRARCEGDAIPRDLQLRLRYGEAVDAGEVSATLVTE